MARTVIDIDEKALANAQQLTGLRKKRHTPLGECLNVRPNPRRAQPARARRVDIGLFPVLITG